MTSDMASRSTTESGDKEARTGKRSLTLKPAPLLKVVGVSMVVAVSIVVINVAFDSIGARARLGEDAPWTLAVLVHIPQFLIPFVLIVITTRGRLEEYGFTLKVSPPFTHRRILGLGLLFGLGMSLGHIHQFVGGTPLDIPRPVTVTTVAGNLAFQWIVVGLSEETMFRGFIQTYLMNNLQGRANILGHELDIGTVIGAIIWGAFHAINILVMPWNTVVFYIFLTTAAGLAMGYVYQESGSLLSTIIIHNSLFGVPLTIGYILEWLL